MLALGVTGLVLQPWVHASGVLPGLVAEVFLCRAHHSSLPLASLGLVGLPSCLGLLLLASALQIQHQLLASSFSGPSKYRQLLRSPTPRPLPGLKPTLGSTAWGCNSVSQPIASHKRRPQPHLQHQIKMAHIYNSGVMAHIYNSAVRRGEAEEWKFKDGVF